MTVFLDNPLVFSVDNNGYFMFDGGIQKKNVMCSEAEVVRNSCDLLSLCIFSVSFPDE